MQRHIENKGNKVAAHFSFVGKLKLDRRWMRRLDVKMQVETEMSDHMISQTALCSYSTEYTMRNLEYTLLEKSDCRLKCDFFAGPEVKASGLVDWRSRVLRRKVY